MIPPGHGHPITTEAELREVIEAPHPHMRDKAINVVDEQSRRFLAASTFYLLATSAADGSLDVSPRGDRPGGVVLLDERHLAFADRPGNRRLDSFRNIIERGSVGMLFLVPGMRETLRVNGHATIVRDAPFLAELPGDGPPGRLGTIVEIAELFLHCGQAPIRGSLWKPADWPDLDALPSVKELFHSQAEHWAERPSFLPPKP